MARSLLALLAAIAGVRQASAQCTCPGELTEVIGHRGTGSNLDDNPFPENTIASLLQAATEGATMVEFDVQLSQDGVLVLMHDDMVDRTTDGMGCVSELDLATLQGLSADGEPIPTLIEVFEAVDLALNIELKFSDVEGCAPTDRLAVAAEVARVLALYPGRRVVVSSFDREQLLAIREIDPAIHLALLFTAPDSFAIAREDGMDAHPLSLVTSLADIEAHHAAGLAVRPFTINDRLTMRRMLGFGVDGIVTDAPDELVRVKAEFCDAWSCSSADAGMSNADAGMSVPDAGGASDGGSDGGGCSVGAAAGFGGAQPRGVGACVLLGLVALRRRLRGGSSRDKRRRSPPR